VVPEQHGAWVFLALPVALAVAGAGWFPLLPLTLLAWVAAYPLSWAVTGRLSAPRPRRFNRALRTWSPVVLLAGLPLLVLRPWLLWVLLAYLGLWLVNLSFARRRRERDLPNDLVLVAECTLMVPVTVCLAAGGDDLALPLQALDARTVLLLTMCAVALTGSVLHVKSLIRERNDPRYADASRLFSAAGAVLVAVVAELTGTSALVVLPFAALALRAWLVRGPRWAPARVGILELGGLVLVVVAAAST